MLCTSRGRRLGAPVFASLLVAIGTVFGTFLLAYTKDSVGEPLAALFVVVAIERTLAGRPGLASCALALAFLTRPTVLTVVPLFLWAHWRGGGFGHIRRSAPPLAIGAAVYLLYNLARFGEPLNFGYEDHENFNNEEALPTAVVDGIERLLFDRSSSVLLFAPAVVLLRPALLWLWRRSRRSRSMILRPSSRVS